MEQEVQTTIEPTAPVSEPIITNQTTPAMTEFKELFSQAWNIYKKTFKTSSKVLLVGLLIAGLSFGVGVATFAAALGMATLVTGWVGVVSVIIFGVVACLVFAIALYLMVIALIAVYQVVMETVPAETTIRERFRIARKSVHPMIEVSFISVLLVLGGMALFIIPGIWISLPMSFVGLAVLFDNKTSHQAIEQSISLVKGRWWSIFFRLFLLQMVFFIVMLPIGWIGKMLHVQDALNNVFSLFTMPLSMIFTIVLWKDLKRVHTGEIAPMTNFVRALMIIGAVVVGAMVLGMCLYGFGPLK
ncbi:MAG: hypothetical protein WCO58_03365 [bacterium]